MRSVVSVILVLLATFSYGQEVKYGVFCRQNPVGDYSVETIIILKPDQTFEYEFTEHMIYEKAKGTFSVNKDVVIKFNYDTSGLKDQNEREMIDMLPKVMKYENNRLYEITENGRKIKSKRLLSKHRRFYLFGDYSRCQNVFLEKVDDRSTCK
ncbi:MAG: hypothetical protein M3512_16205 [Bacteroidota bacterium]|nr:hypothetical protein [Bacteroidota bacterium]MDQ3536336.1 hypothetical protein [Bacteroidota bacterium]